MNHFTDQAIIISVRTHGESGAIVSCLSENHGKCNGYVNGARSSSRLKSLLQQGNIVQIDWQSKSEGQLGRFDLELESDLSVVILNDSKVLMAVQSIAGLIDMFVPEREKHASLFYGTRAFLDLLKTDHWSPAYIMWEIAFLKEMGYGIDLSSCVASGVTQNLTHVSPKSGRAVCSVEAKPYEGKLLSIPKFLQGKDMVDDDMSTGLKMTGYFLMHRLLENSSYNALPDARNQLEVSFNKKPLDIT